MKPFNAPVSQTVSPLLCDGALIRAQQPGDAEAVEALNALAFGPGRFAKTAYRLRRANPPLMACNRVCIHQGELVGAVCFSPVAIGPQKAVLLGPLAVHPRLKNKGIGVALMQEGIAALRACGHELVILVGDLPYYARVGFEGVPPGRMKMPGPVDQSRLLALELAPGALERAAGPVRPDPR